MERFIDAWLVKGKKFKPVAMTLDEIERTSFNADILKKVDLESEFQVQIIGDDGEKLVDVDDVWAALLKTS